MELQTAKGCRDYAPEEKLLRDQIITQLKTMFERYGFAPLETPTLERMETLSAKYAGGAEILKETFKLKDQGDRDLGLRYDLTVPLSRFVGMNPNLKLPFKRYELGKVFRDGPIKAGRLREFWQCDVDTIGTKSMLADAEVVNLTVEFFRSIGLDVVIEVNSRKILDGIIAGLGVSEQLMIPVITAIDKIKKVEMVEIEKELTGLGVSKSVVSSLFKAFGVTGTNMQRLNKLQLFIQSPAGKEGLQEMEELMKYVDQDAVEFSPSLARGLAYYTGTVFEAFLKDTSFTSSLAGGGRYDSMIGAFLGGTKEYPAVGISFGIEPITEVMKKKQQVTRKTPTQVYVIPIKTVQECTGIVAELRRNGINADMDIMGRSLSKNLDYANSMEIPYVIFVGPDELKQDKVKLREMASGKEQMVRVEDVAAKIK